MLKKLSYYLASHPGKEFSYNGLKKNLGLASAMKKYALTEGLILTEHEQTEEKITINGKTISVRVIPIWRWLLQT